MIINGKTRLLGLLGDPVEHTMSPLIHNSLSDILGIMKYTFPFTHREKDLHLQLREHMNSTYLE